MFAQASWVGWISIMPWSPCVQSDLLSSYQHVSVGRTHAFALGVQSHFEHIESLGLAKSWPAVVPLGHAGSLCVAYASLAARMAVQVAGAFATH